MNKSQKDQREKELAEVKLLTEQTEQARRDYESLLAKRNARIASFYKLHVGDDDGGISHRVLGRETNLDHTLIGRIVRES